MRRLFPVSCPLTPKKGMIKKSLCLVVLVCFCVSIVFGSMGWGMKMKRDTISEEKNVYGDKTLIKFKTDDDYVPFFSTTCAVLAIPVIIIGGASTTNLAPVAVASTLVLMSSAIGYFPDLALNNFLYNQTNVGWINSSDVSNRWELNNKQIMDIDKNVKVYETPRERKVVGELKAGDYRLILDEKQINKQTWLKIKKSDTPIFSKKGESKHEGWIRASETSSEEAYVGQIVYSNQNGFRLSRA